MNIYAYDFSKKPNSTAVPSGTGTTITVRLKDNTSKFYPTFELTGAFPGYSYIKWDDRYYFIDDIIQISAGIFDMKCSIDVMATWRSDILNSTQWVARSASSYDAYLPDPELSARQRAHSFSEAHTDISSDFGTPGCYLVRTVSSDTNSNLGIVTYIMTEAELCQALNWMFTSNDVLDAAWDTVVKTIFNPFQYIVSIKWCALTKTSMTINNTLPKRAFKLGWFTDTSSGHTYSVCTYDVKEITWTLNELDGMFVFGDFRDFDPRFTRTELFLPGSGLYQIPQQDMLIRMDAKMQFDVTTGKIRWLIYAHDLNTLLYTFNGVGAVEVQIGQISSGLGETMAYGAAGASQVAAGDVVGGVLSIANGVKAVLSPSPSVRGSLNSIVELITLKKISFNITRYASGAYPTARCGRMLNSHVTISTLSGYCQCSKAAVDTNAPDNLKAKIENYMNSGFYIE